MRQTRCPIPARAADRLTAVVVLPTPPFWLITAMERMKRNSFSERRGSISCHLAIQPVDPMNHQRAHQGGGL